ncbi:hypothetical protein BC936DRAFT_149084 [Jimgerdemannia flammicorona]|uniref:Uncharacterized protein n=1 Tax=Jimgerdemannia flammicorona TaxID=994334 RepID=A0A433D1M6_9FUNG|nr:hypothetical protein BC936DRAFT_149084 [Jimgerdemannia flammicorona]
MVIIGEHLCGNNGCPRCLPTGIEIPMVTLSSSPNLFIHGGKLHQEHGREVQVRVDAHAVESYRHLIKKDKKGDIVVNVQERNSRKIQSLKPVFRKDEKNHRFSNGVGTITAPNAPNCASALVLTTHGNAKKLGLSNCLLVSSHRFCIFNALMPSPHHNTAYADATCAPIDFGFMLSLAVPIAFSAPRSRSRDATCLSSTRHLVSLLGSTSRLIHGFNSAKENIAGGPIISLRHPISQALLPFAFLSPPVFILNILAVCHSGTHVFNFAVHQASMSTQFQLVLKFDNYKSYIK